MHVIIVGNCSLFDRCVVVTPHTGYAQKLWAFSANTHTQDAQGPVSGDEPVSGDGRDEGKGGRMRDMRATATCAECLPKALTV